MIVLCMSLIFASKPQNQTTMLFLLYQVDGEWSEWGNWSTCSVSCDNGTMTRTRLCNSPTPDHGGSTCLGNSTEYDICEEGKCRGSLTDDSQDNFFISITKVN